EPRHAPSGTSIAVDRVSLSAAKANRRIGLTGHFLPDALANSVKPATARIIDEFQIVDHASSPWFASAVAYRMRAHGTLTGMIMCSALGQEAAKRAIEIAVLGGHSIQWSVSGTAVPIGQTGVVRAYGQAHLPECVPAPAGPLDRLSHERSRQDHGTDGFGALGRGNISCGKPIPIGGHEPQRPNPGHVVHENTIEVVPSFLAAHGMADSAQGFV